MKLNSFIIILFIFGIFCFVSPAMAESGTINYDYATASSTSIIVTGGSPNFGNSITSFFANDITKYTNIENIIGYVTAPYMPDLENDYEEYPFTATISGQTVGHGTLTVCAHIVEGTYAGKYTIAVFFDDYNVSGFSGKQVIALSNLPLTFLKANAAPYGSVGFNVGTAYQCGFCSMSGSTIYVKNQDISVRQSIDFHQDLTYDLTDGNLDLTMDKNGYSNEVKITDTNDNILLQNNLDSNIDIYYKGIDGIFIQVTNPYTLTIWENTIPETSTPGPVYDSIIHMSVYDAVTRNLINGHNVTLQYDDNSPIFTTWDGPISHTSIDWFNGQAANVTYSAEGYDPSPTHRYVMSVVDLSGQWLKAGESRTGNVYLNPIAPPSNVTAYAIFDVLEDMPNGNTFYSSGAAVTIGNTTLITAGQGSCSFELSPGNYQYIVKKVGYQTVSGSFVLGASNKYITVNLPKVQTAPTAPQPTGTAGVDYPYKEVNAREQAESSMGIIFDALPGFASLAVIVLVVSFVGWMTPKKRR